MKLFRLFIVALMIVAPVRAAQPERVTIRMTPTPSQTFHTRTTQEISMDISPDPTAATSDVNVAITMAMGQTVTIGAPNEQGRYDARMVFDEVTSTMRMNGQPLPFGVPAPTLAGQTMTITYDHDGRMVDVAGSSGLAMPVDSMKQLLAGIFGGVPPMTLAVGETATVPLNFVLPISGSVGSLAMTGTTTFTLTSISYDGVDRIAHLTSAISGQMNLGASRAETSGFSTSGFGATMKMTGEGTMEVNIDRGVTQTGEQLITLDAQMPSHAVGGVAAPPMQTHGTVKLSQTTVPD